MPQLMSLHRRVIKHIGGKKDLLIVERGDSYFEKILSGLGLVIGAFSEDRLIGYSSLRYPQAGEENFGHYAGLPPSEFPFLAHSNGSMVDLEYRGRGLHQAMAHQRTEAAKTLGLRHLLSEVHGSNPPSLRNLFALGFNVRGIKHENGDDFLIFHQDVLGGMLSVRFETDSSATDHLRQRDLLADGMIGYALDESKGVCRIKFGYPGR